MSRFYGSACRVAATEMLSSPAAKRLLSGKDAVGSASAVGFGVKPRLQKNGVCMI